MKKNKVDFKATATRWVVVNGGNCINVDIAPHVLNELGMNGEEIEVMFATKEMAEEYIEVACMDDYHPVEIEIKYKEVEK